MKQFIFFFAFFVLALYAGHIYVDDYYLDWQNIEVSGTTTATF